MNKNEWFCNKCGSKLDDYERNEESNDNKNGKVRGVNDG